MSASLAYVALVYFLASVPTYLIKYHAQDEAADLHAFRTSSPEYETQEEFDYVIVGGGSAGATLAVRLSSSPGHPSVLLLERGSTPSPIWSVPSLDLLLLFLIPDQAAFALYPTTPQVGLSQQSMTLFAGRVLGWGSSINTMMYIRGSPAVYDEWAAITGDPTWSWEYVLPYFKRSEVYHGFWTRKVGYVDRRFHGVGGPLRVEATNLIQPSNRVFFSAVAEHGLGIQHDLNANLTAGFEPADLTINRGVRWSTYLAFLKPALENRRRHPNLHVYRYATATKVHLEEVGGIKHASGVTYSRHGQTRHVRARKEIIVSAGALESAKLLMLSGIGPKEELAAIGIKPEVNLPVGQHLEDHVGVPITFQLGKNITFVPERDMTPQTLIQYQTTGYGPFHNDYATYGWKSSTLKNNQSFPDLQFLVSHQTLPGVDPSTLDVIRNDTNMASIFLVRPDSDGTVRLGSSDPDVPLVIDPRYCTAPSDLPRLVEGLKWIVNLYEQSSAYSSIGAKLVEDDFKATCTSGEIAYRSDEYWRCVVKTQTSTGIHYTGTCRMGKRAGDRKAVVDSQLRVLGIRGLRVADASIMPRVPIVQLQS